MTIDQLRKIIKENHINENAYQILPDHIAEGVLCLVKEDDTWIIQLNERGEWIINEKYWIESDACKSFLRHVISDPVNISDFKKSDLINYSEKVKEILHKYGVD